MRHRRLLVFLALYGTAAPALFLFAFRSSGGFRVELGAADDEVYRIGNPSAWGRPYQDQGPYRLRRGVRRMTTFAARMAFFGAGLRIPLVVRGGDAELRLRMHRYAQPGVVRVFANGIELGGLAFEEDSYPWDVRRLRVPARFLGNELNGELRIELQLEETARPVNLPPGAIATFDWVELRPLGPSGPSGPPATSRLWPTRAQWFLALMLPLLVYGALGWSRTRAVFREMGAFVAFLAIALAYAFASGSASAALEHLWLAFPLGALVWGALRAVLQVTPETSRRLSVAFILILLSHSSVIFWPQHLPPDVRAHTRQLRRLASSPWTAETLIEISSSYGKEGRTLSLGRRHPEAEYAAPYSPVSYFGIHGARKFLDRPRFLLEYLAIVAGATMVLLAFAIAVHVAREPKAAGYAAALMAIEISTWHHASRAHTPAVVGQMLFMAAATYLLARHRDFARFRVAAVFALLSLAATLAYSATLVHFVLFMAWLVFLELKERKSIWPGRETWAVLISSVMGALGSVALFYRHFLGVSAGSSLASLAPSSYRAPATFVFLRNQVRDTVRILNHGYPLWILLALPAYVNLRSWTSGPFARRVVWAWTATYLSLLVFKDPLLFPQLFLQIKEDLFFAGLLSVLGGITLEWLSRRFPKGKLMVSLALLALFALQVNDYLYNADTIRPPAIGGN